MIFNPGSGNRGHAHFSKGVSLTFRVNINLISSMIFLSYICPEKYFETDGRCNSINQTTGY